MIDRSSRRDRRVLVVDDDEDIRELLRDLLEDEGYSVSTAVNGLDALRRLRDEHERPDCILLDWMMPVLSGLEFHFAKVRDPEIAGIPVIVVSASGDAQRRAKMITAMAVVPKPIAIDALLQAIDRCVERRDGARSPGDA